ncbi:hypothetical protein ACIQRS_04440 [Streptomyces termitum]|uniref:Uncharacterized protein n=1 Tax=Streptomyces termitum TaxID=67368 RepID=A0A918W7Q9_9ACTN|nr:hypothetical protein [Streptomyces termitum]GHA78225.1 hypothetical protein GCM10010305_21860 [Streptomyces termitum]
MDFEIGGSLDEFCAAKFGTRPSFNSCAPGSWNLVDEGRRAVWNAACARFGRCVDHGGGDPVARPAAKEPLAVDEAQVLTAALGSRDRPIRKPPKCCGTDGCTGEPGPGRVDHRLDAAAPPGVARGSGAGASPAGPGAGRRGAA